MSIFFDFFLYSKVRAVVWFDLTLIPNFFFGSKLIIDLLDEFYLLLKIGSALNRRFCCGVLPSNFFQATLISALQQRP